MFLRNFRTCLYHTLFTIKEKNDMIYCNNETSGKAEPWFKFTDDFEFNITLVMTQSILIASYWQPKSRNFKKSTVMNRNQRTYFAVKKNPT